jgi:hypothetical protein
MIFEDNKLFHFVKPDQIKGINEEQRSFLINVEQSSKLNFVTHPKLKANQDKQIYKIGFLSEFLSLLYPEKNFKAICEIMSDRYDVFLSRRQIDRNVKKFKEEDKFRL